jgi:hypothetical protein
MSVEEICIGQANIDCKGGFFLATRHRAFAGTVEYEFKGGNQRPPGVQVILEFSDYKNQVLTIPHSQEDIAHLVMTLVRALREAKSVELEFMRDQVEQAEREEHEKGGFPDDVM